ncbi:MAG: hypothetical protein AB4911_19715 [Oscillochloridaceae bacterium umkhey_bin13]
MGRVTPAALLAKLTDLADDPAAQARFAADLLINERRAQLLGPALVTLEQLPIPEARPALLPLYADLDADGTRHDAGGGFRAAILRILRPWLNATDLPLLERAVTTYEFLPPGRSEEATPIRAAGLVAMADLDPTLAGFHAARLLADHGHTSRLSGEPGKTAATVLAAQAEILPLYLYTLGETQRDEVTVECLRHLAEAPLTIVRAICDRFGPEARELAQIGLVDLLLASPDQALAHAELRTRLRQPCPLTVLRYLGVAMVASRRQPLIEAVVAAVAAEHDPGRRAALSEALALLPRDPSAGRGVT